MTENVLPDENEVKKDNTNKMETEKKINPKNSVWIH